MSFDSDLDFSHSCEDNACWGEIYKSAFPTMVAMINHREDGQHQRAGIDRSIILANSKQVTIDEKARRRKDTGDIMLEFVSSSVSKSPGWVEKNMLCDYIAYAFIPSGTAYLFPVIQLQAAWLKNREDWKSRHGVRQARNATYNTLNCPVPTHELFREIGKMLRVNFTPIL